MTNGWHLRSFWPSTSGARRSRRVVQAALLLVGVSAVIAVEPGIAGLEGHRRELAGAADNLNIDLRCAGSGVHRAPGEPNDRDVAEVKIDDDELSDCIDPLNDPEDGFHAIVRNGNGVRLDNVRVAFSFGQRTNGNAAGANNSTEDATLKAEGGPVIGTNPGSQRTACTTGGQGRCSAVLNNPTPQTGDSIVVVASIVRQVSARSADSATQQWQVGTISNGGRLTLKPATATRQIGTEHTLTARLTNQFGHPVQGGDIDFQITAGPHVGLVQAGMTDQVSNADGLATFTYTGTGAGTDTIQACSETGGSENDVCNGGEPNDVAFATWTSSS